MSEHTAAIYLHSLHGNLGNCKNKSDETGGWSFGDVAMESVRFSRFGFCLHLVKAAPMHVQAATTQLL